MALAVTDQTVSRFVEVVSNQRHAMAGAVIALSAGQATALGRACMQISREDLSSSAARLMARIERMDLIKSELLEWCDRDADAIAELVALREAGETLAGQILLCRAPAAVSQLTIEAANILQKFRPLVSERVHDDLEMSISLLAAAAQAALLLLDSNLRIWPEPALLAEFEPILDDLAAKIDGLSPVKRLRE